MSTAIKTNKGSTYTGVTEREERTEEIRNLLNEANDREVRLIYLFAKNLING